METQPTAETKSIFLAKIGIRHLQIIRKCSVIIASIVSILIAFGLFTAVSGIIISLRYETDTSALTFIPLLGLSIIYILPPYWLWMFSKNLKYALAGNDAHAFESALKYLKLFFAFMAAVCIIMFCVSLPSLSEFSAGSFSYFFK